MIICYRALAGFPPTSLQLIASIRPLILVAKNVANPFFG
jgi:hypothetical protein